MSSRAEVLGRLPRKKFVSVAAQMDANEEGVVIAAALALKRVLADAGLNWRTILPALIPDPEGPSDESWRNTIDQCIQRANVLSDWEVQFLLSLRAFTSITPKQRNRLNIIAQKCGAAR